MQYGLVTGLPQDEYVPKLKRPLGRPAIIDIIGDSHTANGLTATPPRLRTGPAQFTGKAWYVWASMQAQGRIVIGRVDGRAGAVTTDLATQYLGDLLRDPSRLKAGYCLIAIGTNSGAVSQLRQNAELIRIMTDRLLAAGVEPIIATTPPRTSFQTWKFNTFVRLFCDQNGLKCVEFAQDPRMTDPSTGAWISGYSDDNVHANDVGAKAMGSVLYDHFNRWGMLTHSPTLTMINGESDTLTSPANALLMTDTNADGVPDGWTLTGAGATSALAAISSSVGLGNEMTVTRASASTTIKTTGRTVLPSSLVVSSVRVQTVMAGTTPSVTIRLLEQNTTPLLDFTTTQDIPAGYVLTNYNEVAGGAPAGAPMTVYASALITAGDGTVVKLSQPTIYDLDAAVGQSVMPL